MNFIRTDVLTSDIIQAVNPDIVIMERAERYIYNLANNSNVNLLMPRLNISARNYLPRHPHDN